MCVWMCVWLGAPVNMVHRWNTSNIEYERRPIRRGLSWKYFLKDVTDDTSHNFFTILQIPLPGSAELQEKSLCDPWKLCCDNAPVCYLSEIYLRFHKINAARCKKDHSKHQRPISNSLLGMNGIKYSCQRRRITAKDRKNTQEEGLKSPFMTLLSIELGLKCAKIIHFPILHPAQYYVDATIGCRRVIKICV